MEFYNLQNLKYVCYLVSHKISTLFTTTFTFTKYYDLTTNRFEEKTENLSENYQNNEGETL